MTHIGSSEQDQTQASMYHLTKQVELRLKVHASSSQSDAAAGPSKGKPAIEMGRPPPGGDPTWIKLGSTLDRNI